MKPKYENFSPSDIQYSKTKLLAAIALKNKGQLDKSIIELKGILSKFPTYAAAHLHIAEAYIGKSNWIEATKHLGLVRLIDPEDINAVRYLEAICVKLNLNEAGRELSDIVEKTHHTKNSQPNLVAHLLNQASLLVEDQQYEKALESLKQAEKQDPNNAKIALELGQCLILLGKSVSAAEVFKKVAFEGEDVGRRAMSKLSYCGHHLTKSELNKCIETLESEVDKSRPVQPYMTFALANYLDLAGLFEKSWDTLSKANSVVNTQFKNMQEADIKWRDHVLASVKKSTPQDQAIVSPLTKANLTPIFILGVSRSGKSTLERLLGEVKSVKKGFESRALSDSVAKANQRDSRIQSDFLPYFPPQLFDQFSKYFVDQVTLRAGNARFFTTTKPTLIAYVTDIARSLSHSKFVFIKRDLRDNAVRILQSHYGSGNAYAYDPMKVKEYIEWYFAMIDIWCEKFPDNTLIVQYEDLVADAISTLVNVLDFTGIGSDKIAEISSLPYDDRGVFENYSKWLQY